MADPPAAGRAAAEPAALEALLALAERAVALQPAAEVAIQHGRPGAAAPPGWAEDARRVLEAYRSLRAHLRGLALAAPAAGELAGLLDHHAALVAAVLAAPVGGAAPPEGLGAPAGRLVGLRDRLRRGATFGGRPVSDVTPGV